MVGVMNKTIRGMVSGGWLIIRSKRERGQMNGNLNVNGSGRMSI